MFYAIKQLFCFKNTVFLKEAYVFDRKIVVLYNKSNGLLQKHVFSLRTHRFLIDKYLFYAIKQLCCFKNLCLTYGKMWFCTKTYVFLSKKTVLLQNTCFTSRKYGFDKNTCVFRSKTTALLQTQLFYLRKNMVLTKKQLLPT